MSPSQLIIVGWGWGFHTVRGDIDPRDHWFRPWVVGVSYEWKDSRRRDETLSSLCAAGPRRWPEGQLSQRTGSMIPANEQSVDGCGVFTSCGTISTRGVTVFVPEVVGMVDV